MPGTIRVTVLEAVDLPEVLTDGSTGKDVTAKVTLGPRLFKTKPGVAGGGRIESWNSDFDFPVMNLRDKLVVSICDSKDHSVTQTAIEIPSIIQKGSRDEFVALEGGGRIHLKLSFVLTDEERKKIEIMRVAALKRREEAERQKKMFVFQPVQPIVKNEPKTPPVPTVVITEVDVPPKNPPAPKPMFNYAKAIGVPANRSSKKTETKPSAVVPDNSTNELKTSNGDVNAKTQTVGEIAKDAGKVDAGENTVSDAAAVSPINAEKTSYSEAQVKLTNDVNAINVDLKSEVQTSRESAEDVRKVEASETSTLDSSVVPPRMSVDSAEEKLTNEIKLNNGDTDSKIETVGHSARDATKVASSGNTKLVRGPASAVATSTASAPGANLPPPTESHSSGAIAASTPKTQVEAHESTIPKVSSKRRSRRGSWLRGCVRKALSNVKMCIGAPPNLKVCIGAPVDGQRGKKRVSKDATQVAHQE